MGVSKYPNGFAGMDIDPLSNAAGDGDGVVSTVEDDCSRERLDSPEPESELDELDSPKISGGAGESESETEDDDPCGPSRRRLTLGGGPSVESGGPRKKEATACEAAS